MKILVINPGSTSTKIGVYEDTNLLWKKNIHHDSDHLKQFTSIAGQYPYRKELILSELRAEGFSSDDFRAVIGRGGLLSPLQGGVYAVNEKMIDELKHATREHASNLGAILAYDIAAAIDGCMAFIADPVVVDELDDVARVSGLPGLPRVSIFHALNHKAIAHRYARDMGRKYEELDLIVVHMGGGISVGAHRHGRVIDVNNALDGEGPLSPERAGTLPAGQLVDLCFSGNYDKAEIKKMISGKGGMVAHLGTNDARVAEDAALAGDAKARLINEAMIYGVAKLVGSMFVVLGCHADAILLTGGMAHSDYLTGMLRSYVGSLAPIVIYPGEDELGALAENAYNALTGAYEVKVY